ncbi:ABC transporter permease [Nonomuraea sp. NPDC050556]|uniref:ABC transporter permease n=1 Tax=Nonomuraea sp. NPDC050556 TaxID=3364369 RepID=UPI00379E3E21
MSQLLLLAVTVGATYFLAASVLVPRVNYMQRNPPPPAQVVEATLDKYNINDKTPVPQRFATWAAGAIKGDFGKTWQGGSVNDEIARRAGVSLRLLLAGTLVGVLAGVLLGSLSAVRQYGVTDRAITVSSFVLLAAPTVVIATVLIILATKFNAAMGGKVLEFTGEFDPSRDFTFLGELGNRLNHLILPTLTLALIGISFYSRYQRNMMLDTLNQDFIRTALAKGLSQRTALYKHALRTSLIPTATYFAFSFGTILTGSIFVEKIFGWHGMGAFLVDSIQAQDINSVVAGSLFAAICVVFAALLSDLLVAALDPRVRVN